MFIHYQKCRIHPPTPEPVGVGDACPITQHLQTTSKVLGAQFFGTIALMEFVLKARANSSASQYVASSQRSSPQLFPKVSLPSTLSSLPYRSFPRSFSHSLPPVHPLITPVSLLPHQSSPQAIPHVSPPSTISSLPYRSFPPELSPSYFSQFPHRPLPTGALPTCYSSISLLPTGALPKLFPTVSLRPPSRHSRIAPSHRSSPQAISHGFPSVHTIVASLYRSFPTELPPSYFPRFPFPYRSFPPELSPQAIFISHDFLSVHPVVTPVYRSFPSSFPYRSFPPKLSPSYFPRLPFRPPCRHSRIAPSHRSSPQAISHGFPSVHPVSSLPYRPFPPELSPSYFRRAPFRPPCRHSRIAPSHRSSPQAISHGFPSVHPVVTPVSLLPTGAPLKLFPTASLPSTLSSLPYRSFPPELSPSYSPRFPHCPSSRHSRIAPSHRSFLPIISDGFPYFPWFPFRAPYPRFRIAPL